MASQGDITSQGGPASPPHTVTEVLPRITAPAVLTACTVALAVFVFLAASPNIFNDGDTGWHLVTGRIILATGAIPTTDPFSFTFLGQPWVAHEWLAEVVMAGADAIAGLSALALLVAAAVAALVMLLGCEIGRWLPPRQTVIVLLLVTIALVPFVLARPHVLAWPLLAGWTILLLHARAENRRPPLVAALVMLVWANLHASFIFGLGLAGLFGLEALAAGPDRRRIFAAWGLFGIAALLAALATPHGIDGLVFPLMVSGMATIPAIVEWRPTVLAHDPGFALFLIASIAVLLTRGVKVPVFRLLLLCGTLFMAFQHVRHQALLAIIGSLILAAPLAATSNWRPRGVSRLPRRRIGQALVAILAIAIVLRIAYPIAPLQNAANPRDAIAGLAPGLRRQPVFNAYGFGGALTVAGIRPYIDGRADMYGDAFILDHDRIIAGDIAAFDRAVRKWRIGWTILEPGSPLAARLDTRPGWRRAYADAWAVVHVAAVKPAAKPAG